MTVRTRAELNSDADTLLPDNTAGEISPADVRGRIKDLADSACMIGGQWGLAASVSANALTISLKGADGNDPSAGNPVTIPFRNVTPATGTPSLVSVAAATSLVINSGSTMGFASATAGRIWIVAFNDAGTVRLGAINCRSGTNIYPLGGVGIASSTAEGGAGAADSAHVFYTGTAVTSKAFAILGYMDWAAGLTAAGTWDIVPTTIRLFSEGCKLPGDTVQSANQETQTNATASTATWTDTNSTVSLSPTAAPNVVAVFAAGPLGILSASADKRAQARLSRGGSQIGVGTQNYKGEAGTQIVGVSMAAMDAPGTVSSCTWTVQIQTNDASQTAFYGHTGSGVGGAFISATEIMA